MTQPNEPEGSTPPPSYGEQPPGQQPPPPPANPYQQTPGGGPADPYGAQPPSGAPTNPYADPPPNPGQPENPYATGATPPGYGGYPAGGYQPGPAPGYAAGPGGLDVGAAVSWAWGKFKLGWGSMVGALVLWALGIAAVTGIVTAIAAAIGFAGSENGDISTGAGIGMFFTIMVGVLLAIVGGFLAGVAMTGGYLAVADGRQVQLGDFFQLRHVGKALVAALLIGLGVSLLYITIIGPLVISFFTCYTLFFIVDRGMDSWEAIKASSRMALDNAGPTILMMLVAYALAAVGSLACGVGVVVTGPIAQLVTVYVYRKLTGGVIAPVAA